jgi:hypothetical protein
MGFMERLGTHSIDFSYELSAPIEKALLVPACGNDKVFSMAVCSARAHQKGSGLPYVGGGVDDFQYGCVQLWSTLNEEGAIQSKLQVIRQTRLQAAKIACERLAGQRVLATSFQRLNRADPLQTLLMYCRIPRCCR